MQIASWSTQTPNCESLVGSVQTRTSETTQISVIKTLMIVCIVLLVIMLSFAVIFVENAVPAIILRAELAVLAVVDAVIDINIPVINDARSGKQV
jgi:hypothetical protein